MAIVIVDIPLRSLWLIIEHDIPLLHIDDNHSAILLVVNFRIKLYSYYQPWLAKLWIMIINLYHWTQSTIIADLSTSQLFVADAKLPWSLELLRAERTRGLQWLVRSPRRPSCRGRLPRRFGDSVAVPRRWWQQVTGRPWNLDSLGFSERMIFCSFELLCNSLVMMKWSLIAVHDDW